MSHQFPKTILFDMDDTILVYDAISQQIWQQVCRDFAPRIIGLAVEDLLASVREVSTWFWGDLERHRRGRLDLEAARQEIVTTAFSRLEIDAPQVAQEMADTYSRIRQEAVEPIPGAVDTLRHLRGQGIKLGLVTNGEAHIQRAKIERFQLEPWFEYILIEGEFGVGKPHEKVYRQVLAQLDARPADTWMVGDNLHFDVGGSQALGIYGVWVDWEQKGVPENSEVKPDRIVQSIAELMS
ncbi:MAG: HAD family hydrolase [Dehalococcoidia bacterium]